MVVGGANGEPGWGCFAFPGTGSCSRAGLASSCGEATWWSPDKEGDLDASFAPARRHPACAAGCPRCGARGNPGATSQVGASTAVASWLANRRGLLWTADGTLY